MNQLINQLTKYREELQAEHVSAKVMDIFDRMTAELAEQERRRAQTVSAEELLLIGEHLKTWQVVLQRRFNQQGPLSTSQLEAFVESEEQIVNAALKQLHHIETNPIRLNIVAGVISFSVKLF